jgi:HD-GYP domain-containing protein (c-di-GMP phosphodiesterase class II)
MRLGLTGADLDTVYRGGLIHDIGKIGVPDSILLKPGPLDAEEQMRMRLHPIIGENIVTPLHSGAELLPIIRHHHESFDGTGYPDGLAGDGIPRLARIVSVCDAYDALINDRPYRRRLPVDDALSTLADGAGIQWDPEVVETFVRDSPATNSRGVA